MKHNITHKLIAVITVLMATTLCARADSFEVDGIRYSGFSNQSNPRTCDVDRILADGAVVIPETVTYEGITYTVTEINLDAIDAYNNITSLSIPGTIEEIMSLVFCQSLTDVDLPDMLKRINEAAFNGCQSLTNIDLPAHLGFILEDAFTLCGSLESIRSWASTPPWPGDCFDSETYDRATLYIPNGSLEEYKRYQIWSRFDHIVEFDPTGIADGTATPGGLSLWADGGTLHVDGLTEGTPVEVYTTDGKLVYQGTATDVVLPEGNLYIVRAAGQTSKIIL